LISIGTRCKPGAAHHSVGKKIGAVGASRVIKKEDTAMNRHRKQTPPLDLSTALTFINLKVMEWKRLTRRRFEARGVNNPEAFESLWPSILTNFFYAETERVSRSLGFLSEDRNN
jgi:hypothetical protein